MKALFVTSAVLAAVQALYEDSLEDCIAFAQLFNNSCDSNGTYDEDFVWSTELGNLVNCDGVDQYCVDSSEETSATCQHRHKLCVSCEEDFGDVYIYVKSNSLPDHCFRAVDYGPSSDDIQFRVIWNLDVDNVNRYNEDDYDSTESATDLLCSTAAGSSSSMPSTVDYTNSSSGSVSRLVGVARDGVRIDHPFKSGSDVVWKQSFDMDTCLAAKNENDVLAYHTGSPCVNDEPASTPELCEDDDICSKSGAGWNNIMTSGYSSSE